MPSRSPEVVVEALEGISNERQTHLRRLLRFARSPGRDLCLLDLEHRRVVGLVNLVCGEVRSVDSTRKARLERSADPAQRVKFDAAEEGVALDLVRAAAAETVLGVDDEAIYKSVLTCTKMGGCFGLLSNQVLGLGTQRDIIWEVQTLPPVDNLSVCVMAILGTERRPAHQTLEHDSAQTPPIAVEAVSVSREDLGCNIVGSSHSGIGH